MIRARLLLPLAVVLAGGCAGVTDSDAVARFEDTELGAQELSELMTALGGVPDGTSAAAARDMITTWVRIEAVKDELDRQGVEVTAEQVDAATQQMSQAVPDFGELSDRTRDYLVDAQAAFLAFGELPAPSEADLAERYARGPADSGITCVRHILVETEAQATAVVDELAAGADFAELATERSADPGSAQQGGILPCTATDQFAATFVPPFVDATLVAEIGEPTEPVESDFGFHVILVRPFEDAQAEIAAAFQPQEFAIAEAIERSDIHVDPRYGTLIAGRVTPLS